MVLRGLILTNQPKITEKEKLYGQSKHALARIFLGVYMSPIRINTEAEAHANRAVNSVSVVITRSTDGVGVGVACNAGRTQPPVVILLVGLGGAILLVNR